MFHVELGTMSIFQSHCPISLQHMAFFSLVGALIYKPWVTPQVLSTHCPGKNQWLVTDELVEFEK